MCNCSKPISQTDCQRLLECVQDPERRTFIYHIAEIDGLTQLEIAHVPKDRIPNDVAKERGFLGIDGLPEWYYVHEHPCLYP